MITYRVKRFSKLKDHFTKTSSIQGNFAGYGQEEKEALKNKPEPKSKAVRVGKKVYDVAGKPITNAIRRPGSFLRKEVAQTELHPIEQGGFYSLMGAVDFPYLAGGAEKLAGRLGANAASKKAVYTTVGLQPYGTNMLTQIGKVKHGIHKAEDKVVSKEKRQRWHDKTISTDNKAWNVIENTLNAPSDAIAHVGNKLKRKKNQNDKI